MHSCFKEQETFQLRENAKAQIGRRHWLFHHGHRAKSEVFAPFVASDRS